MPRSSLSLIFVVGIGFLSSAVYAGQGVGSSGGGSVVFLESGEPLLTDLVTDSLAINGLMTKARARKYFERLHPRFLKQVASFSSDRSLRGIEDPALRTAFIDCAMPALEKVLPAHLRDTLQAMGSPGIFSLNVPLPRIGEIDRFSLPPTAGVSPIVSPDRQFPVGRYYGAALDIDGTIFARMSPFSQCALAVHENLRSAIFFGNLHANLEPMEIEEYTRFVLNLRARDERILAGAKAKLEFAQADLVSSEALANAETLAAHLLEQMKSSTDDEMLVSTLRNLHAVISTAHERLAHHPEASREIRTQLEAAKATLRDDSPPFSTLEKPLRDLKRALDPAVLSFGVGLGTLEEGWYRSQRENEIAYENERGTWFFYAGKNLPAFKWFDRKVGRVVTRALP